MSTLSAFAYKVGALGGGNDVASGDYTLEEAALKCLALGALGFTHQGPAPQPHQKVRVFFKSSTAGNDDPAWATYTPHLDHKVGALGGGNDLEAGSYTLHDAWLHSLKMPACVGFTYQGVPNQQGKVQCYFKSSGAGNADPNWQTYLKKPGANVAQLGAAAQHPQQQAHKAQVQARQAAAIQPQVCLQCQGQGGLGTFGPVPRGHMHWKRDCPNCEGRCKTINTIPCQVCKAKGGQGTFGPCGLLDVHFKSPCGACGGKGYTSPLGQPPAGVAPQPVS